MINSISDTHLHKVINRERDELYNLLRNDIRKNTEWSLFWKVSERLPSSIVDLRDEIVWGIDVQLNKTLSSRK